jgi:hypothetical protein
MARPSKKTGERVDTVCMALREGATYVQAAGAAGISHDTLTRWRRDNPEIDAAVQVAEHVAAARWLGCIDRAADRDWKAAAWLLERRFPEIYRRPVVEVVDDAPRQTVYQVFIDGDDD